MLTVKNRLYVILGVFSNIFDFYILCEKFKTMFSLLLKYSYKNVTILYMNINKL